MGDMLSTYFFVVMMIVAAVSFSGGDNQSDAEYRESKNKS